MLNALSLLIKPVSARCGLNCAYCFYKDSVGSRKQNCDLMAPATVRTLLKRAFELRPASLSIAFQGGEPTLAGPGWYRGFLAAMREENTYNVPVELSIQTNGVGLEEETALLLKENGFLVGLSLDGDELTHDRYRKDAAGNGTFARVMEAAALLRQYEVPFNVLAVVTDESAEEIEHNYAFFKENGLKYLQFIPPVDEGAGITLSAAAYECFLKRLFDLWYADFTRGDYVSVRQFDNWVRMLLGAPPESCDLCGVCGRYYVIEADGSVYPCDFYCKDAYRLCSVFDAAPFAGNEKHRAFIEDSLIKNEACRACVYYPLCRGGCRRRRAEAGAKNQYCEAFRGFFAYAVPRLKAAARFVDGAE